jgi:predicted dehydrogenase
MSARRIGMVGCGHIANVHAYAITQLADADLIDGRIVATYDTDPARAEKLARRNRAEPVATLDALLDAVDVVWVCTWTAGHLEAVEAAADRDLAIFCEKPLAPTLVDCERVAAALERVPHQVGLVLRHAPVFAAVADLVATQRYGRVLSTTLRDDQYFPIQGMYASTWRKERSLAGGGTLIEHSIHDIDVLRWLLGDPADVAATTATRFGYEGIDDTACVRLGYRDGSQAVLTSVWHQIMSRGSSRRLEVFFEDAYCWTEDDYLGPLVVQTSEGTEELTGTAPAWAAELAVPEVHQKAVAQYAEPTKAFLDGLAAESPRTGHPGARDALAAHRVVDAAYRSAAAGGAPAVL